MLLIVDLRGGTATERAYEQARRPAHGTVNCNTAPVNGLPQRRAGWPHLPENHHHSLQLQTANMCGADDTSAEFAKILACLCRSSPHSLDHRAPRRHPHPPVVILPKTHWANLIIRSRLKRAASTTRAASAVFVFHLWIWKCHVVKRLANDPSSATRLAGSSECNHDAMPGSVQREPV